MVVFFIALLLVNCVLCDEFLKNPGFESPDLTGNWAGAGFQMQSITNDVHSGKRAVKVSGRTKAYQGPGQDVAIVPGGNYVLTSSVKQLNDHAGRLFQTFKLTIAYTWADSGHTDYSNVALHPYTQSSSGWVSLSGDFTAPQRNFSNAHLYYQGPDPGIDFLVDDASLQSVVSDPKWKSEANARIQKIRKNNIHVHVTADSSFHPADIEIKIDHKRHLFGFGTNIRPDWITNADYKEYQNLVYDMFNWATVSSLKWKFDRGTRNHPDFKYATDAIKELKKHGMNLRGHNLVWDVPGHSPGWVEALNGPMLKKTINERLTYMLNITKGQLEHWDVNNEMLHGQDFEEKTGDPLYSEKIYDFVHKADPYPKLFLNDYDVVAVGSATDAYVEQAKKFKNANVGVYGLGIQSHFPAVTAPNPTLMKRRLDKLASVGLPLWVTELDLQIQDDNTRADWYEMVLRTYFSHPAVEGVVFWGFWDHDMNSPYDALVSGYSFYINAAGRRYLDLVKKEWATHESHMLSRGSSFTVNGFQGDYDVVVYNKGVPIMYQEFQLGKADKTLNIHITGNGGKVSLPTTVNPFVHLTHPVHMSHNGQHLIGRASTTAQNSGLQCVTRWSGISPIGDNKAAYSVCQSDEVMMGCSSTHKDGAWYRDGETIEMHYGKIACKAINGYRSKGGAQAVARCCKTKDLKCNYRGSGPSLKTIYARVETTCQQQEIATGCSEWSWNSDMDGAYPSTNHKGCIAQNDGTTVGVSSYAACCTAPSLTCKTAVSKPSGLLKGNTAAVNCEPGYMMTGCNVRADFGKSAGAYIGGQTDKGEWCIATNGEDKFQGETGAIAVAVCCKLGGNGGSIIG